MMQDPITDLPPPSRNLPEELNTFASPSPALSYPKPFFIWSPGQQKSVSANLLVVAIGKPACHLVHNLPSKTLIATLVLPECPMSGDAILDPPSLQDKACYIYALHNNNGDGDGDGDDNANTKTVLASVQYSVTEERANVWAKTLIGELTPQRVLIASPLQPQHFRGRLSRDDSMLFKLETTGQRKIEVKDLENVPYFPSGSMVDGLAAAILVRCQIGHLLGRLLVYWPGEDTYVVSLLSSVFQRVCPLGQFDVALKSPFRCIRAREFDLYT